MAAKKSISITGHIRITDKVYFEYYELDEPNVNDYEYYDGFITEDYPMAMKAYEASKQLVEVKDINYSPLSQTWILEPFDFLDFALDPNQYVVINNQICKASIKNNKATIISLTKQ